MFGGCTTALVTAGAKAGGKRCRRVVADCGWNSALWRGYPRTRLPQETEQERALSFVKGCYVGQEIVERIRSRGQVRRKFTGFEIHGALPAPGSKVQVDGKDVGEITSVASLPFASGDRQVALGYIRREVATPDKIVDAGGSEARIKNPPLAEISK